MDPYKDIQRVSNTNKISFICLNLPSNINLKEDDKLYI